jgi:hypothetical protein
MLYPQRGCFGSWNRDVGKSKRERGCFESKNENLVQRRKEKDVVWKAEAGDFLYCRRAVLKAGQKSRFKEEMKRRKKLF